MSGTLLLTARGCLFVCLVFFLASISYFALMFPLLCHYNPAFLMVTFAATCGFVLPNIYQATWENQAGVNSSGEGTKMSDSPKHQSWMKNWFWSFSGCIREVKKKKKRKGGS